MAVRVPNATGNWSTASNWLTASNTPTLHASTTLGLSTTARFSATFTAPNTTNKCTGVAVYVASRTAAVGLTVTLQENSVTVATATVAAADLPLNCEGWFFVKFATPYQYTSTTAGYYRVGVALASGTATALRADSGGTLVAFLAVDDRTGAVAGTDDVYVLADVGSTKTVTYDQNSASVACLTLQVGYNATISFSTAKTTQFVLGNGTATNLANIFPGGTFAIGTVNAPIPAAYTATFQADAVSNAMTNVQVFSGANGSVPGYFSAVGDPAFNARARTVEGYATGWYATTTSTNASAGATSLVLADDLGLRAGGGDVLAIGECNGSSTFSNQFEHFTTTAYNAATKTVTLAAGLTNLRNAGAVVNVLNRNVVIKPVSTTRLFRIVSPGTNTAPCTGVTLRHVQLESMGLVGNNSQNSAYTAFGGTEIVGCAGHNPANGSMLTFYNLYSARLINCHWYRANMVQSSVPTSSPENGTPGLQIIASSALGQPFVFSASGVVVRDGLCSAGNIIQSSNGCRAQNMVCSDMQYVGFNVWDSEFASISCKSLTYLVGWAGNTVFDAVQVAGNIAGMCDQQNAAYTGTHLIRNCVFANTPTNGRLTGQPINQWSTTMVGRAAFIQNCVIPGYPDTMTLFGGGQLRRYVASSAPQAVSPLPSGAAIANRFEQLTVLLPSNALTTTFRIPVPDGAQNNTITIPVYLSGWGASLPSASELYVELFAPGATVPIVSTSVVTANDQWQYLTVSGVSTGQGHLIVRVVLKKYVANAVLYVDWPVGNYETSAMDWYDGRPNEYVVNRVPVVHSGWATFGAMAELSAAGSMSAAATAGFATTVTAGASPVLAASGAAGFASTPAATAGAVLTAGGLATFAATGLLAAEAGVAQAASAAFVGSPAMTAAAAQAIGAAAAFGAQPAVTAAAEVLVPYPVPGRPATFAMPQRPTTFTVPPRPGGGFDPPGQG